MPSFSSSRMLRPTTAATLVVLAALFVAACGGSTPAASPGAAEPAGPTSQAPASEQPATSEDPGTGGSTGESTGESSGGEGGLAAIVPADKVQAALGEAPTPECDTSVLTGAGSCVWTAGDGSWLKVEDGTPQEMPDLAAFTERITGTLGLEEPVDGLGEAAYLGSSSRGTRIAVFLGEGRVAWVVLNKPGDAAAQAPLVKDIATTLVAGL